MWRARTRLHSQAGNAASAPSQPSGLAAGAGAGAKFIDLQATLALRPHNPLAWLQELALEPDPQDPSGRYLVERGESFFTWFDPPDQGVPLAQDIDSTAEALKDDIWPNPYKFYIGEIGLEVGLPPVPPMAPGIHQTGLGGCMVMSAGFQAVGLRVNAGHSYVEVGAGAVALVG